MSNKFALLIGINKYPFLADFAQLKGCLNDVFALKEVLEQKFNFPPENIATLLDEQATRSGILEAMKSIVANCGENDSIVFSFSGHGARLKARKENKPSGWYETIMPFDSGRKRYHPEAVNRDIKDDEIYEWLTALSEKTSNIVLIFDSCYAGSILREYPFEEGARGIEPDETVVHDDCSPIFFHSQSSPAPENLHRKKGRSGWLPADDKYVLMAACAEYERAHLYKEQVGDEIIEYGVFTYFLCKALRASKSGDTYRDIWEQVYLGIKTRFEKQTAQLEGKRDRELFGLREFAPFRYLPVSNRENNHVTLSGGAIHGVSLNSQWSVYPLGTKEIKPELNALGKVKIISVEPLTARALLVEENVPGSVIAGNRAIEVSRSERKSRLSVSVENISSESDKRFDELIQNIRQSSVLKLTSKKELANVRIQMLRQNGNSSKLRSDGNIPESVYRVYGQDGSLLMPPRQLNTAESVSLIVENLERLYRYRRLLELRNSNSAMSGRIDFKILKQNPDLTWTEAKPTDSDSNLVIRESERIALQIINRFDKPIFFSILDFGLSKNVSLIYPPPGAIVMIAPLNQKSDRSNGDDSVKGVFTVGMKENEILNLWFPPNYPPASADSVSNNLKNEGLEIIKLIVTTRPHDLSFLEQSHLRTSLNITHRIENLFFNALRGDEDFEEELIPEFENEWLTIEKFFFLGRG